VECDQQGIVFNAHYLVWCDEAVVGWFRATGSDYAALTARGLDTRVVSSTLDWAASARYGDVVDVDAWTDRIGRTSFTIAFEVRVAERRCCAVRTTYVLVDDDGAPIPVPDDLRVAWERLAA
jgi:acyl-CoA thioester hydrolase